MVDICNISKYFRLFVQSFPPSYFLCIIGLAHFTKLPSKLTKQPSTFRISVQYILKKGTKFTRQRSTIYFGYAIASIFLCKLINKRIYSQPPNCICTFVHLQVSYSQFQLKRLIETSSFFVSLTVFQNCKKYDANNDHLHKVHQFIIEITLLFIRYR